MGAQHRDTDGRAPAAARRRSGRARRRESQRGAVAVEAALVIPILLLLVFGIIEMSLLMRDVVAVSSSVRVGARVASAAPGAGPGTCQAGANPPPCTPASVPAFAQTAANAIQRQGSSMPMDQVKTVLVFEANSDGYPLPAGNKTMTCAANCVTYVWDKALDKFRYASGSWASSSVNACVNNPPSAVGVAMLANHPWLTNFFTGTFTISERSVMQFEPLDAEHCQPGAHL